MYVLWIRYESIICEMTSCVYIYEIICAIICELNSMFIVFDHRQYYAWFTLNMHSVLRVSAANSWLWVSNGVE